jgi:hypothetical protein
MLERKGKEHGEEGEREVSKEVLGWEGVGNSQLLCFFKA